MGRYAVAVVVSAADSAEAHRFLSDMLDAGVRWDRPLPVHHIGPACEIRVAADYATAEVHLLADGMREVLKPEPDLRDRRKGGHG